MYFSNQDSSSDYGLDTSTSTSTVDTFADKRFQTKQRIGSLYSLLTAGHQDVIFTAQTYPTRQTPGSNFFGNLQDPMLCKGKDRCPQPPQKTSVMIIFVLHAVLVPPSTKYRIQDGSKPQAYREVLQLESQTITHTNTTLSCVKTNQECQHLRPSIHDQLTSTHHFTAFATSASHSSKVKDLFSSQPSGNRLYLTESLCAPTRASMLEFAVP